MNIQDKPVRVKNVGVWDATTTSSGEEMTLRVAVEVPLESIGKSVPLPEACRKLVEDSKGYEEEGPNTIALRIKRKFPMLTFRAKRDMGNDVFEQVEATCQVKGQLQFKVVEAKPSLHLVLQGQFTREELAFIGPMVNRDLVTGTLASLQGDVIDQLEEADNEVAIGTILKDEKGRTLEVVEEPEEFDGFRARVIRTKSGRKPRREQVVDVFQTAIGVQYEVQAGA